MENNARACICIAKVLLISSYLLTHGTLPRLAWYVPWWGLPKSISGLVPATESAY